MNIFEFMGSHPMLTFWLSLILVTIVHEVGKFCINRPLRHRNIRVHGWPPAHCDADGDFKKEKVKK